MLQSCQLCLVLILLQPGPRAGLVVLHWCIVDGYPPTMIHQACCHRWVLGDGGQQRACLLLEDTGILSLGHVVCANIPGVCLPSMCYK